MRLVSWNTNCGWCFNDATKAQAKVDHLVDIEGHFDLAFLMEHPKCSKLFPYGAAIVKDQDFKFGRFDGSASKDTRTVGLYIPSDSKVRIIEHKLLAPAETCSFIFGYVVEWKGEIYHVACLWNYIPKDCLDNDYKQNVSRMLECSKDFLRGNKQSILIGDFNIPAFHTSRQRAQHEKERDALHSIIAEDLSLEWLDYEKSEEEKQTCYISKGNNGLAIDFCAVSPTLFKRSILQYGKWDNYVRKEGDKPSFSDHVPLILTIN